MENRQLYIAVQEWLENYKKDSVKALTYDRLEIAFKLMKKYPIAGLPVDEIDCDGMQRYIRMLVTDGYSLSTIKKQFNLLTAYWKHGMARGIIANPVYMNVSLPNESSVATPREDIQTYSPMEQRLLLSELMKLEHEQYGALVLMLEAGLRIGETLALRWEDVLWNRKAIIVRRTLIRLSSKAGITYVQEAPKSKTSKRTIPLSVRAIDILQKLYDRAKWRNGYIFARPDDQMMPYSYSSVEGYAKRLFRDLDIPYRGLHAFRHTFATNCYERGCDVKILSKLLGHADVAITYNTYIHLYGDALEEMRKVLG